MYEFKQSYQQILQMVIDNLSQVRAQLSIENLQILSDEEMADIKRKTSEADTKLSKIESNLESMAMTISKFLTDQHAQEDELAKSLKEIEVCYKKNKDRLERDLNKMQFKVTQIKDTRERLSLRHIKSLDIVEKVVHKVMPNSLTESQIQNNMIVASNTQGSGFESGNAQLSSIEQIRNDLENDDIFTLVYRGGGMETQGSNKQQIPDDDGDQSSNEEEISVKSNEDINSSLNSDYEQIRELKSEKKRVLESIDDSNIHDRVLVDQIFEMEIQKLKKSLRQERRSAAQSYRHNHTPKRNEFGLNHAQLSHEYKSQSLKNSQKLSKSNLNPSEDGFDNLNQSKKLRDSVLSPPQDKSIINDQSPVNNLASQRYLKITKSEQQPQKSVGLKIVPQQLFQPQQHPQSTEKKPPMQLIQIKQIQQAKPFVLNKKFVNLIKRQNGQQLVEVQQQQQYASVSNQNLVSNFEDLSSPKQ